jgi:CRP-like cAMP-binding protein
MEHQQRQAPRMVSRELSPQQALSSRHAADAGRAPRARPAAHAATPRLEVEEHRNRLVRLLPDGERAWLLSNLEPIPARLGGVLAEAGEPLTHVYFPLNCIASLVNPTDQGFVEVGTVGSEGFVGLDVFLGANTQPSRIIWQISGDALRMPASTFVEGIAGQPVLERLLRRYTYAFLVQATQSASCNRMHALEQRCARWLLMTHDRVEADTFRLTQQFLGYMLGVHRPAVTLAAQTLQRDGLISYSRGTVTIQDRAGLEERACECYALVRDHFARLLGADG